MKFGQLGGDRGQPCDSMPHSKDCWRLGWNTLSFSSLRWTHLALRSVTFWQVMCKLFWRKPLAADSATFRAICLCPLSSGLTFKLVGMIVCLNYLILNYSCTISCNLIGWDWLGAINIGLMDNMVMGNYCPHKLLCEMHRLFLPTSIVAINVKVISIHCFPLTFF